MLTRRICRILPLIFLLTLLAVSLRAQTQPAAPAPPRRFFWKVSSPTATVYFLGSIHVATKDMYPLPPEIDAAYASSKNLAVEADITKVNQLTLALQIMQQGMYSPPDSLDKHLAPKTMKAFRDYCQKNGLPAEGLNTMKPVLAAMTVEAFMLQKQGLSADDGIDLHFLNLANDGKDKKIVELESADSQMKLLFGIDDKLAEKWLLESLKEAGPDELDKVVKAWKTGDDKALAAEVAADETTDPDALKMNDLLLYQRNAEMTKKIDAMLQGKDETFLIVGAAHLVGDKGVLKQLEAKGYKVERPALTAPPAAATASAPAKP